MKNKHTLIILLGLVAINLLSNSCKKDTQATVESLLARGTWQLASITVGNYIGGSLNSTDTLNTKCSLNQTFSFSTDNTCTYQDFACISQTVNGRWQLSDDKITLQCNISCQDTLAGKNIVSKPFTTARIVNLGHYSLVLETGDLSTFFLPTQKRQVKRYGFVRF